MKDPAFLFYPNDWIGGTMGMTFEEKGAYMELLMMQFNRGHMTSHMIGQTIGQLWLNIQSKFIIDKDGLYFNQRLEDEQIKRKTYTQSRNNNLKGENQYTKKDKNNGGHMSSHMENENIDVDIEVLSEQILKLNTWLKENAPRVLQMKQQITESELSTLKEKYNMKQITGIFKNMHNYAPLLKKNISVYLTANNWLLKDTKDKAKKVEDKY